MNKLILTTVFFLFTSWSWLTSADQNDPRLDQLFEQLHAVDTESAGSEISDQIWEIWRFTSNEEANDLMKLGISAMQTGKLAVAKNYFDDVIAIAPEFAEGWNKRATVYYFLQEYDKSLDDIRQTLTLEPRHFGATAGLGLIFLQLNYLESALEAFREALAINPHLTGPKIQVERLERLIGDNTV